MKSTVIVTLFFILTVQAAPLRSDEDPLVRQYRDANYTMERVLHELLKQPSLNYQADGQRYIHYKWRYCIAGNFRGFKLSRIFQKPVLINISRFLISRTVLVPGQKSLHVSILCMATTDFSVEAMVRDQLPC